MTLDAITAKLNSEGFFPIRVEGDPDKDEGRGLVFVGDLDEFIRAAKALKVEVIFAVNRVLDHSDFQYEAEEVAHEDDDSSERVDQLIDLSSVLPSISKFEKYIGQDCAYKLSAPMAHNTLDFYTQEPWWTEFVEMYIEAVEKIEEDREAAWVAQRTENEARQEEVLDRLRQLINDSDFVRLPTQKAMLIYAVDKIPELEVVDQVTLQSEIQTLNAKIAAKGLSRKR
jgi:hypothetical protein